MVDLKTQYSKIANEVDKEIKNVIDNTAFINGPAVKTFAADLASFLNVKHVIPCGNGTDALQIALMSLDLKPGDEVITSTFTFIATAEVIALLGLKPVFVDVNADNYNIAVDEIQKAITTKTKVILPVHLYGQCAPMEDIMKLARAHNIFVVEDTAQAIGAEFTFSSGKKMFAGTIGDFGTTSFFPSKNLGCYGDGGALYTNNDELAAKAKMITNHGSRIKYDHEIVGVNSRLDTIQATILSVKLPHLKSYNTARYNAAKYYSEQLRNIEWITTPKEESYSTHVFHQYTMKVENGDRDKLKEYLAGLKIPSMIYYPIPLHQQKAFLKFDQKSSFHTAESLASNVISLPMHTELTKEVQDFIIDKIKAFK